MTLPAGRFRSGGMNSEAWLEKAERLRSTLADLREARRTEITHLHAVLPLDAPATLERVAIAHWLRQEFSEQPAEDTQTMPLFSTLP